MQIKVSRQSRKNMTAKTTMSFMISPRMIRTPSEKISAMVSMSETARVTSVPIGVLSKYLSLKPEIFL